MAAYYGQEELVGTFLTEKTKNLAFLCAHIGGQANVITNHLGGKVNRMTLTASQGDRLNLSLDEVIFRDLQHDVALPSTSVSKYTASPTVPTATKPTEEPMVFSEGTIGLFELGNTFARILSFTLSLDNQITEQRYQSKVTIAGGTTTQQIPYELTEGQRVITLEMVELMETRE